jgi:hypothetical protein
MSLDLYQAALINWHGKIPNSVNEWNDLRNSIHESDEAKLKIDILKNAVYGTFTYLKKYKTHNALYSHETDMFYATHSLGDPIENMIEEYSIIKTALIEIEGRYYCDGLIQHTNMMLGKNYQKTIRDAYWDSKRSGTLIGQYAAQQGFTENGSP